MTSERKKKLIKLKAAKVRKAQKKTVEKKWPWKKLISIFSNWERRMNEQKKIWAEKNVDATICPVCVLCNRNNTYAVHHLVFFLSLAWWVFFLLHRLFQNATGKKGWRKKNESCLGMHCARLEAGCMQNRFASNAHRR